MKENVTLSCHGTISQACISSRLGVPCEKMMEYTAMASELQPCSEGNSTSKEAKSQQSWALLLPCSLQQLRLFEGPNKTYSCLLCNSCVVVTCCALIQQSVVDEAKLWLRILLAPSKLSTLISMWKALRCIYHYNVNLYDFYHYNSARTRMNLESPDILFRFFFWTFL